MRCSPLPQQPVGKTSVALQGVNIEMTHRAKVVDWTVSTKRRFWEPKSAGSSPVWCANFAGRLRLRSVISAAPD